MDGPRAHAAVAAAIPDYAAGLLTGEQEASVRRHLAGGCRRCLDALFAQPVGVPRSVTTAVGGVSRRGSRVLLAVGLVVGLMGTVVTRFWYDAAMEDHRAFARAAVRVDRLEESARRTGRRLVSLGARARRLGDELRELPPDGSASGDAGERRRRPLGSTDTGPAAADRAFARLGTALATRRTAIVRLDQSTSAAGARGWVGWDPTGGRLFVYAVGLPRLRRPWEAGVTSEGHTRRSAMQRLPDGGIWAVMEATAAGVCVLEVAIFDPGSDRALLRRRVDTCRARPAA